MADIIPKELVGFLFGYKSAKSFLQRDAERLSKWTWRGFI
jgi:hypothetical protein